MRRFWFGILVVLAAVLANPAAARAGDRPNVLFLALDDLRDWVGFMEGSRGKVHTPNLDRLAARGTAFLNAHTASPVCCPSRAAAMSGRLPSSTGLYNNQHWWKPNLPDLVTIPAHFKRQGYITAGAGKIFHHTVGNNPPEQWDEFQRLVFHDDAWTRTLDRYKDHYPFTKPRPVPEGFPFSGLTLYSPEVDWGALSKPERDFDDARTVDFGVRFLQERHERPFFLACGTFRPHLPWYIPRRFLDLYPEDEVVLPRVKDNDLEDIPEAGRKLALRKNDNLRQIYRAGEWRAAVRHYLASISFADAQIGKLLDALDGSPYAGNTVIVLWSDHGWHFGEKEHWHKRTLWEVCTRVPLIVAAPTTGNAGQECTRPASLVDLFPTLIELCGLPEVEGLDGESLVPLLKDPGTERKRPAVIQSEERHCAVKGDRFRYIRYRDGTEELYDLETDPHEWDNRLADPELQEVKQRLSKWVPKQWAKPAENQRAFEFDPGTYSWTHRKSGRRIP